jgi:radical SAM superfamily enzyme YgiQ (UPF0313 family)
VKLIDAATEGYTWDELKEAIRREAPDVVGITAFTKNAYLSMTAARVVKELDPRITVIAGGQHFTAVPEESLAICPEIDFIVVGEGELTAAELLDKLSQGAGRKELRKVRGLAFLDGKKYVETPPRPLIPDLDALPMPDYDMLPMHRYHLPFLEDRGERGGIATTSRGCIGHCLFCSDQILWRSRWRGRSAASTVDELELLHRKYGWMGIQLGDAAFTTSRERNEQFIVEMQKRNLFIRTWPQTRADAVVRDRDLWKGLRATGVTMVLIGIEAPEQRFLDNWKKEETIETLREAAGIIHEAGIPVLQGTFMVGGPEDTKATILARARFARELGVSMFAPNLFTPFPGTAVWREMIKLRRIENWNYADWDFDHAVMATETLAAAEVEELDKKLFLTYSFNPAFFLKQLANPDTRRAHVFFAKNLWYMITRQFRVPEQGPRYKAMLEDFRRRHLAYVREHYFGGEEIPAPRNVRKSALGTIAGRFRNRV